MTTIYIFIAFFMGFVIGFWCGFYLVISTLGEDSKTEAGRQIWRGWFAEKREDE